MKRLIACMLVLVLLMLPVTSMPASALNGNPCPVPEPMEDDRPTSYLTTSSNGEYEYVPNSDGTLTFVNFTDEEAEELEIPAVIDGKRVKSVDHSFQSWYSLNELKKLTISEGIESVESWRDFSSLESIVLPNSLTSVGEGAFVHNESLRSVTFGNGLSYINMSMFFGCKKLENLTLPESVSRVGCASAKGYVFSYLKNIDVNPNNPYFTAVNGVLYSKDKKELVYYPAKHGSDYTVLSGTEKIGADAFRSSDIAHAALPDTLTSIGENAFSGSAISSLELPSSVSSFSPHMAAENCYYLTSYSVKAGNPYFTAVDGVLFNKDRTELIAYPRARETESYQIPNGVKTVKAYSFQGTQLKSVTLPNTVETIEEYAFANSGSLSEVKLNNGLKEIGSFAFSHSSHYYSSLKQITLPETLETIGYGAFYESGLRQIVIPASVKTLSASAFEGSSLEKVEIKAPLTAIGTETFSNCQSLNEVVLPDTLTYIGPYAFCFYNGAITIPDSVREIDPCAFYYSSDYSRVTLRGTKNSYAKQYAQDYDLPFEEIEITATPVLQSILEASVEPDGNDYTYDGAAKQPGITLKLGNKTLTKGTDYTVRYENNINAGKAQAIITGIGDYTDSLTLDFNIRPQDVSALTYTVGSYDAVYNGSAKRPVITVKDGTRTLTQGKDYAVTYSVNTDAGTAYAKVICMGNYAGSTSVPFTVEPKSISGLTLTVSGTYTYDGTEKRPAAELKDGDKTLTEGKDYTVSYTNNINAGTAKITVTGIGNYRNSLTRNFTIAKRTISGGKMSLSENCYGYDGKAKCPGVTVELGGIELIADTDYTVSYTDNINIGTARATVNGKGNYTGTLYQEFTIEKRSKSIAQMDIRLNGTANFSADYTGYAITPTLEIWDGSTKLVNNTDYTFSYIANVRAGTAGVLINGKGDYVGSELKTFRINPISGSKASIAVESAIYDGTEKRPGVTITYNGTTLKAGTDYDIVSYANNIGVGTGTVTIAFKGNYLGTENKSFQISRIQLTDIEVTLTTTYYTYNGKEKTPDAIVKFDGKTLKKDTDYTLSYSNNINAGTAYVYVTPKGNYSGKTQWVKFTISQRLITYTSWDYSPKSFTYDGTAKKPTLTPLTYNGLTLKEGTDYTVAYENNISAGEASIRVAGKGNYCGSVVESFHISGVAIPASGVSLEKTSYDYTGSAIRPSVTVKVSGKTLTLNKDYTVSYSNNISAGTGKVIVTGMGGYTGSVTKEFTIKSKKLSFTWGKNNWTFTNSGSNFYKNYNGNNPPATGQRHIDLMNETYISALKRNLKTTTTHYYWETEYETIFGANGWAYDNWHGSCYGMSALVMLDCAGLVPNASYTSGAKSLHDNTVAKNNTKVANLITYYYLLQGKDAIQEDHLIVRKRAHSDNIKSIVADLNNFGVCQVDFRWYANGSNNSTAGHSVVAYGYTSGTYGPYNGVTYDRCIKIADPNCSDSMSKTEFNIYFKSSDYSWIIPHYTRCSSKENAFFVGINSNIALINYGGYLGGTSYSPSNSAMESTATARLDTMEAASDATLTKAYENNGEYYASATGEDMVKESNTPLSDEEAETYDGYTLHDVDSSYILNQSVAEAALKLDCLNYIYKARGSAIKTAVFDKEHKVRIDGVDTDYFLSMTVNGEQPTDWATLSVEGDGVDSVTLEMTDGGYLLSADDLSDVTVKAYNAENDAELTFSTGYDKALLYEVNETTIGVRVDADGDGSFEKDLMNYTVYPLDDCNVTVDESVCFTGEQLTPEVTVTNGDETLVEGRDYTVYYANNVEIGTAVVTVKGIGSYVGAATADFLITEDTGKLLGDTDNDTDIDVTDVTLIQRYVGSFPVSDEERIMDYGDIDENGTVNIIDATYLQYWIAEMDIPYPIGHMKIGA